MLITFYNKTYKIYDDHAPLIKTKRFKGLDGDLNIIARIWNCQISKMVTCHWVKSSKSKNFVSKIVVRSDSLSDLYNRSPIARVTYNYCLFLMITVHNNEEIKYNEVTALCEFVLHYVYSFCYMFNQGLQSLLQWFHRLPDLVLIDFISSPWRLYCCIFFWPFIMMFEWFISHTQCIFTVSVTSVIIRRRSVLKNHCFGIFICFDRYCRKIIERELNCL